MNSIIEPCHAMSAVMEDVPTGTTAERTCQSPRSETQSRHARPRREVSLSSSPNGGQMGAFSQPERAKRADIQRIKILKCLQMGGVIRQVPNWRQAFGLSSRSHWYMFSRHPSLLLSFLHLQKYKDFLKRPNVWRIFLPCRVN